MGADASAMVGRLGNAGQAERERFNRARHGRHFLTVLRWLAACAAIAAMGLGVRSFVSGRAAAVAKEAVPVQASVLPVAAPVSTTPTGDKPDKRGEKAKRHTPRGQSSKRGAHHP
jgi:hypothetical protein